MKAYRNSNPLVKPASRRARWSCVRCNAKTVDPKVINGRAGCWRVSTRCVRCRATNYHSKHGSWVESRSIFVRRGEVYVVRDETATAIKKAAIKAFADGKITVMHVRILFWVFNLR